MSCTVAALVVTNRPRFREWWTHQIAKQTRKVDQVVVVTNAADPSTLLSGELAGLLGVEDVVVYWQPPEPWVSLGWMRQKATDLCSADAFMWFDDDDWVHPRRVELTAPPIESGRYDGTVMPLTHDFYLSDRKLRRIRHDLLMYLPTTTWRREAVRRARFFHVAAAEDCHWIHRVMHCYWAPPVIPAVRIRWANDYSYPHIGAIIVVHGGNTWQSIDTPIMRHDESIPLPKFPPAGVSREEWQYTVDYLSRLEPQPQRPRQKYKPSTAAEWDASHQSGLVD